MADGAMCSATKAHVRLHVGVAYIHIVNCIGLGLAADAAPVTRGWVRGG